MLTESFACACYHILPQALFGDVNTHQNLVLPQAESYIHRFGPGIVLYFFGHAPLERLGDAQGSVIVKGWDLPTRFMLPTGEIISAKEPRLLGHHSAPHLGHEDSRP
jgi:hypothetical protein